VNPASVHERQRVVVAGFTWGFGAYCFVRETDVPMPVSRFGAEQGPELCRLAHWLGPQDTAVQPVGDLSAMYAKLLRSSGV